MACGVGGKTPCDEGGVVLKGVGGVPCEIVWRRGVEPKKPNIELRGLDIGTRKKRLGECMGGPYRIKYMQWPKVWERVITISCGGGGIVPKIRILSCVGSILVGGRKQSTEWVDRPHGMRYVQWFKVWERVITISCRGGGIVPKSEYRVAWARYWSGR
jgi:hypothetical protein